MKMNRKNIKIFISLIFLIFLFNLCCGKSQFSKVDPAFKLATENGKLANEGFARCLNFVNGWLQHADPETGLIPRNLNKSKDIWNAQDSAADNYSFMVLTTAIVDKTLYNGKILDMLNMETKLTSRIGNLPDTYSFTKNNFNDSEYNLERIIFGASEYIKDGLLPLTEWLGKSPWSERMIKILDDIWKYAPIETKYGNIPSTNIEVNGEMLQALSRIYWMTGNKKYLNWAIRLGDYYLLDEFHPTKNMSNLRLRDHGCEIVSGLCELYATVNFAIPDKKKVYEKSIHEMLDRILEIGRNEHGLFYNGINPQNGEIIYKGIADTFGYNLNGFYTVFLLDKTESYREATLKVLNSLNVHYKSFPWEGESSDGYADAIESALNLYNREPIPSCAEWIDSEVQVMWVKQKPDGVIEGWHGDGNFARTTIMYCLWKTQGITIQPWREDVIWGAVLEDDGLKIKISSENEWSGKIIFDKQRHIENMKLPIDWPRINQFPEWFTVDLNGTYKLYNLNDNSKKIFNGEELANGIEFKLKAKSSRYIVITK